MIAHTRPGTALWDQALAALFARWGGAGRELPALEGNARGLVERLARTPEGRRAEALGTLRQALAQLPLSGLHPSWVAELVPADPLLATWTLSLLPTALRRAVAERLPPEPAAPTEGPAWRYLAPAPLWYRAFFEQELARRMNLALPRPGGATGPLGELAAAGAARIGRTLERWGLPLLAAALAVLGPREALRIGFSLPAAQRELLRQRGKAERDSRGEAWADLVGAFAEQGIEPARASFLLALEDLAVLAAGQGAGGEIHQIAYRLEAATGRRLLERFAGPDSRLALADPKKRLFELKSLLAEIDEEPAAEGPQP
ncbi:MAG: hypothetical protein U0002_06130 [Thermoanaerobaculia bacterium]